MQDNWLNPTAKMTKRKELLHLDSKSTRRKVINVERRGLWRVENNVDEVEGEALLCTFETALCPQGTADRLVSVEGGVGRSAEDIGDHLKEHHFR